LLRVEEGELDAQRFERLLNDGHAAEALALWRGPALSDLGTKPSRRPRSPASTSFGSSRSSASSSQRSRADVRPRPCPSSRRSSPTTGSASVRGRC
jgi:hypothetical protein